MDSGQTDQGAGEALRAEALRQLRSTYGPAVLEGGSGGAGLYALLGHVGLLERRCRNPVLVAASGSVGAKLRLAEALGRRETVGLDLVAACVNELLVQGALPLFFLAHLAGGGADAAGSLQIVKGIAKGCRQADCALLGSGVEARGDLGAPGERHLAGFAVGMVERARLLDGPGNARPGDAVLGIASSGLHLGGFERAQRVLLGAGGLRPEEQPPELGCPLGEELLRPTRIYVRAVRALLERYRVKGVVHGLAHVGDGGLAGSVAGVLGRRCVARIERAAVPRPPVFDLVQRVGGLSDGEMLGTFNLGVGMVAVVAPFYAEAAIRRIRRAGDRAAVIGEVAEGSGPAVEVA